MMTEGRNLNFILRRDQWKNSYERRDYAAVAGKQQFSIARTNLPPLVTAGGNMLRDASYDICTVSLYEMRTMIFARWVLKRRGLWHSHGKALRTRTMTFAWWIRDFKSWYCACPYYFLVLCMTVMDANIYCYGAFFSSVENSWKSITFNVSIIIICN